MICRPETCNDMECECEWRDSKAVFCIGKTPWRVDVIDDKPHRNDHQFCIISEHRGWEKHRINRDDMDLMAKAMFSGIKCLSRRFNLSWYFGDRFHLEGNFVVVDDEAVNGE